jgi:hypothetical protein
VTYDFKIASSKMLMEVGFLLQSNDLLINLLEEYNEIPDVHYLLGVCSKLQKKFFLADKYITHAIKLSIEQNEDKNFLNEMKEDLNEIKELLKNSKEKIEDEEDDEDDDYGEDYISEDEENDEFNFDLSKLAM